MLASYVSQLVKARCWPVNQALTIRLGNDGGGEFACKYGMSQRTNLDIKKDHFKLVQWSLIYVFNFFLVLLQMDFPRSGPRFPNGATAAPNCWTPPAETSPPPRGRTPCPSWGSGRCVSRRPPCTGPTGAATASPPRPTAPPTAPTRTTDVIVH